MKIFHYEAVDFKESKKFHLHLFTMSPKQPY